MDDRYNYPPNYPPRNDLIAEDFVTIQTPMDNQENMSPYIYNPTPSQYNPYYVPTPTPMVPSPSPSSVFSPATPTGDINTDPFYSSDGIDDPFAGEPPLLEELGINFDQIMQKTLAVIIPFKKTEQSILHESDLTGPLVFCFAFGMFLLLSGKLHFSYIYGIGIVGCLSVYFLLNLMSPGATSITLICTVSVLGYSLLPMVVLSGLSVIFNLSTGVIGKFFAITAVLWCALSASKLFVTALALQRQQPLIAYPCALLYGVFALLTVF
ncbi:protein YIPF5-like [Panonychus citri]|uniref:protein YIPF5-like n=1 Tax=Panonychus citri TaxID=50023 RepID=UPI0023073CB8|nr:protein YIPF5-like [Panonychus citri]